MTSITVVVCWTNKIRRPQATASQRINNKIKVETKEINEPKEETTFQKVKASG